MRLVHLQTEIYYAEEVSEYSLAQKVHKAITGKMPREPREKLEEDALVQSTKRKLAVRWDTESCGIILEQSPNINYFTEVVMPLLDRINTVAPIDKIEHRSFITHWLLPTLNYNFAALERKYRETMIVQNPICQGTFDSSVILDIRVDDAILHHQSGAMGIKQLLDDFQLFKLDDAPKVFLFMLASITERKVIQYSSEEMYSFLVKSFDHCKSHSYAFERIWEEVL